MHRKTIEAAGNPTYPLDPTGHPAEIPMPGFPSQGTPVDGHHPILKGEIEAESVDGQPFSQR